MRMLITGSRGQLGSALARAFPDAMAFDRQKLDLSDAKALRESIREHRPRVILNAAAYTAVDQAETEAQTAFRINAQALEVIGAEARALDALVVHWSTDYVFGASHNNADRPYREVDPTDPVNVYGASKLAGEQALEASGAAYLVFRCSWVYAEQGQNFIKTMLRVGAQRKQISVVADQWGVPTSADWLAASLQQLFRQHEVDQLEAAKGVYHWVPAGTTHWAAYAEFVFACAGMQVAVQPISSEQWPTPARRPGNSRLDCTKAISRWGLSQPDWKEEVAKCVHSLKADSHQAI
ncbi:MAG: dTDP-4-dehydrorhamnose reductase [Betaproteobacteria bacterium]|nr:dTDP-4-dehydrorhamnose reductase [Betaproteobacteria bacterium]NDD11152.1 dTDP-4-dehydrorhamnose reductase [Betaproteobacteria bacterium]